MNHVKRSGSRDRPPSGSRRWRRHGRLLALGVLGTWALGACSLDGLLKSNELPPNVTDPAITQTPEGARAAYYGTLQSFQNMFGRDGEESFLGATGLLSDELSGTDGFEADAVDLRQLEESPIANRLATDALFTALSTVRQRAGQAIGLLGDYVPEQPALRAHLYAIQGYAEVMLAELFCSGIPLSTVDYKGDYTLKPGSSTEEVFAHATALFDTALVLAGTTDSAAVLNLSRVGRGRALLGLGNYAAAAAVAAMVPDTFRYAISYTGADSSRGIGFNDANGGGIWPNGLAVADGVADREGANGLNYRSSGDPRTQTTPLGNGFYYPTKYRPDGADTIVLASGVEARLIAAEAALHAGDPSWLDTLNALRARAPSYDPSWPALPDTTDPGSDSARVSLLFRERAFWLFLTGHRQGDMRRLVRQYHRPKEQVYPVGLSPYGGVYDSYIDAPIPWDERTLNPKFTGCGARG